MANWLKNYTKWYFDPTIEGGGGSSDFSTATVTFVNNTANIMFLVKFAMTMSAEGISASMGGLTSSRVGSGITLEAILYRGNSFMEFELLDEGDLNIETSGSIQNMSDYAYMVTGDCTITIS